MDGFDNGVDMDSLEAAQGKVSNVRAFDISRTSATVGFLAPGCPGSWSTDNFATYIQTIDAEGTGYAISYSPGYRSRTAPFSTGELRDDPTSGRLYYDALKTSATGQTVHFVCPYVAQVKLYVTFNTKQFANE